MEYKLSKFAHYLTNGDAECMYNSLNVKKVYGNGELKLIKDHFSDASASLDSLLVRHGEITDLLNDVIEAGLIVPTLHNEDDDYYDLRNEKTYKAMDIRVMHLMISTSCNYSCKYCCVDHNKHKEHVDKNMSIEVALNSVDKFFKVSKTPTYINFFGGEPLLNYDVIKAVVEYIKMNYSKFNIAYKINTNGSLITEEVAQFLAENKISTAVSFDGTPEIHNENRVLRDGNPTFESTLKGWWNLHRVNHPQFGVVGVLHSKNANRVDEMLDFFFNQLQARIVNWEAVETVTEPSQKYMYPTADEVSTAFIKTFLRLEQIGAMDNVVADFLMHFVQDKVRPYRCIIHWGACCVDSDGRFGPCFNLIGTEHFKFDDFNIDKMWMQRNPFTMEACKDCIALGICGGICAAHSLALGDNIETLDMKYSCKITKNILDWAIWDLYNRLNEANHS